MDQSVIRSAREDCEYTIVLSARNRRTLLSRRLYSLAMRLLVPVVVLRLLWRGRDHVGYRSHIRRRFGWYGHDRPAHSGQRVWIHAVSVGETLAVIPLIERLLAERPDVRVLMTSTTPTGADQVRQKLGDRVDWDWAPFDTPGAVKRFFEHWHPVLGAFVETEIWPNTLTHAAARGVPTVLLNARMSAHSARGYARLTSLTRHTLAQFSAVAAQNPADARRLKVLGVKPETLTVTGSLKFALDAEALRGAGLIERTLLGPGAADRPTWLAASTHPGEEAIVLEAFSKLKVVLPAALLILAPRHPERVASVLTLPEIAPYRVVRHSALQTAQADNGDQGSALVAEDDIVVVDSLGRLGAITGCADVVLIGGSLVPHGGHNPLEAAAWQLPIMTGPHTFNFARIYRDLFQQAAAIQVDADSLTAAVISLLADQAGITQAAEMGHRAQQYQSSQGDVLGRQWTVLTAHLP